MYRPLTSTLVPWTKMLSPIGFPSVPVFTSVKVPNPLVLGVNVNDPEVDTGVRVRVAGLIVPDKPEKLGVTVTLLTRLPFAETVNTVDVTPMVKYVG
jgi:hypothetical protein